MTREHHHHVKATLPKELARRAEHAKVDLNLSWSAFLALAVEKFLEADVRRTDDRARARPASDEA